MISVLVVFVLVLFATYYVTKWIGKSGVVSMQSRNIKVIETFKIAPNKYIQIVRLGSKYYSIGVTKDNISFLTPLDTEQLDLENPDKSIDLTTSFQDIFSKITKGYRSQKKDK